MKPFRKGKASAVDRARDVAEEMAPVVWLLGKTQAGKTSLVAELTGRDWEEVGQGFEPVTKASRLYAFPPDVPAVCFYDTRGLEDDAETDPAEDMARVEDRAHLLLVVARAEDRNLEALLKTAGRIRKAHPEWPLLVAQTRLHDLYPRGADHPRPYPGPETVDAFPDELRDALRAQRKAFSSLPGADPVFVPLDFTRPEDGYDPVNYGADALWDALRDLLPPVYERLHRGADPAENARRQVILPWAFAAAGADAVPVPFLGGVASTGLQARMVDAVARRFGLTRDSAFWTRFMQLLGASFCARYGIKFLLRQGIKGIPGLGTAAVAVWSFSVTYALGEAAVYFCRELAEGREPEREALRDTYARNLERARSIWRERGAGREDA